jgi:hypothetical protein
MIDASKNSVELKTMKRAFQQLCLLFVAAEVLVVGQSADVNKVLAGVRAALGGDKVATMKTLAIEGRSTRSGPNNTSNANDFEMAFEFPDRYMKKEVVANLNGMTISRRSGFNGDELIDETDAPPNMGMTGMTSMAGASSGGGNTRIVSMGPGAMAAAGRQTPEQLAEARKASLAANRRDYARLMLGLTGAVPASFPVEFTYAGQAESPDGKADILELRGRDGFVAKFFVDQQSHLPLMVSWMDREPLRMTRNAGSPQDAEKLQQEMAARMKEAEANRKTVEYRLVYADYKPFSGVQLPTRLQRMIDGFAVEELSLEKIKVNQKIDPKKFETSPGK